MLGTRHRVFGEVELRDPSPLEERCTGRPSVASLDAASTRKFTAPLITPSKNSPSMTQELAFYGHPYFATQSPERKRSHWLRGKPDLPVTRIFSIQPLPKKTLPRRQGPNLADGVRAKIIGRLFQYALLAVPAMPKDIAQGRRKGKSGHPQTHFIWVAPRSVFAT